MPASLVCNGRFKIGHWETGHRIILTRNLYYRGYAEGNLDAIHLQFVYPDLAGYLGGDIDWCLIEDQPDIAQDYPRNVSLLHYMATYLLGFACSRPPFNRALVRQAFAMSVDRETLVQEVWSGVQRPAWGGAVPPSMVGHSPEIGLPFDPESARACLR